MSPAPYINATAAQYAPYLPSYQFNLTSQSLQTRYAICNSTVSSCATAKCTGSGNVTSNFCNAQTMGYSCQCSSGTSSRLQLPIVPVNSFDCTLRAGACLTACQDPRATPPVLSVGNCTNACNYIIASTCSTNLVYIPSYAVSSYNDVPSYYPDTRKGGVAAGITTKSSGNKILSKKSVLAGLVFVAGFAALI